MNKGTAIITACALLAVLAGCAEKNAATDAAEQKPKPRPATISGVGVASDGDTVIIDNVSFDLWGIEAPSLNNSDGWYSRAALDRFIGVDGQLVCSVKVKRRKRRSLTICSNGRVGDIGRAMLQNGWAVVNRRDKRDRDVDSALAGVYDRTEQRARKGRVGLWVNYPLK